MGVICLPLLEQNPQVRRGLASPLPSSQPRTLLGTQDVPRGVQVKTCLAFTAPHRVSPCWTVISREQLAGLSFGPCHLSRLLHPLPQGGTAQGEGRHPELKCGPTHPPDFRQEEVGESLKTSLGLFVLMQIYYFSPVPYHFPKCPENKIFARALTM